MKRRFPLVLGVAIAATLATAAHGDEPERVAAIETVTGRVMLDANDTGTLDDGDRGLADVLVTDGIQFVRTAADGSYTLKFADDPLIPYRPAQVISVCWPSGTWPAARRFFARRADIQPKQSVDFLLRPQKQSLPFTFAHGTDPHDNMGCGREGFGDDIKRMGNRVNFCVMSGDLGYATRDGAEKMFSAIEEVTRQFSVPLLHTPGNHDIVDIHTTRWSEQHPLAGYGPYTKYLGPIRYSFNYAGAHFIGLDWARIMNDGKLETGVPDTVIDWLKKDLGQLKPGTRTFVFMHHHYRHGDSKFWDLLAEHKVEMLLAGHSHRNKEETTRGVEWLTTQNLCGPYRLVTVHDKGHAVVNRCYAGSGAGHRHSYAGKCKMTLSPDFFKAKLGVQKEVVDRQVDSAHVIEGFQARQLEIVAEIDPGTSKKCGVRVGAGQARMELGFHAADDELHIGDLVSSAVRGRGDKTFRLRIIVADGKVAVYANNRVQLERAFSLKDRSPVELFADGGSAVFSKVELREVKSE